MVVYQNERELRWHQLLDKGLEVALVAHADPGQNHGECVGLSRAFDLAERFGAVPIDHLLSYELMMRYSEQFEAMMSIAGSNHTWLSTTLCIYTGSGKKDIRPWRESFNQLLKFGFFEETAGSMDVIVTSSEQPKTYRVYGRTLKDYKEVPREEVDSFLYVAVPEEFENRFMVVTHPNYRLKRKGKMACVQVDWEKAQEIPREELKFAPYFNNLRNSSLLPDFLRDGFRARL